MSVSRYGTLLCLSQDFLSAVEDAENQLAGVLPGPVGCLSPTSSCPQAAVQIPYPRPPALRPSAALAARRQSAPELCRTDHSTPSAAGDALRPCLTSCSWSDGQGPDWPGGAWEGPAQDELDQVLAGLELDLGASAGDPPPAKRARVSDLSGLTSHPEAASPLQEPRETAGPHRTPQLLLRPGATWAAANPPGHIPQPCGTSVPPDHCNPQSPGPWQPYLPPQTWAGNKPGPPGPQAPGTHSCAVSLGTSPAVSSISTPRGPRTSLQTPVVTNHLVQLVTATTRTPARAQTRRFPGPAGLLPQQVRDSSGPRTKDAGSRALGSSEKWLDPSTRRERGWGWSRVGDRRHCGSIAGLGYCSWGSGR